MRPAPDREALVVGMTLVPGFVSRNRNFALFQNPEVRRARVRAALLRGIVGQLSGAQGPLATLSIVRRAGTCELSYRVPGVRLQRRALLTETEYACVAYLACRGGVAGLRADDGDRARIDAALRRLVEGSSLAEIEAGEIPLAERR